MNVAIFSEFRVYKHREAFFPHFSDDRFGGHAFVKIVVRSDSTESAAFAHSVVDFFVMFAFAVFVVVMIFVPVAFFDQCDTGFVHNCINTVINLDRFHCLLSFCDVRRRDRYDLPHPYVTNSPTAYYMYELRQRAFKRTGAICEPDRQFDGHSPWDIFFGAFDYNIAFCNKTRKIDVELIIALDLIRLIRKAKYESVRDLYKEYFKAHYFLSNPRIQADSKLYAEVLKFIV